MLSWVKHTTGLSEREYGPSAIQSVAEQAKATPYTDVSKKDLAWEHMHHTNVETKTFYVTNEAGTTAMVQLIYSALMGLHTTAQFNSKIFSNDPSKPHLWTSDPLYNFHFNDEKQNFKADHCSIDISEDGKSYHIKSTCNKTSIVDLTFTQTAPGFMVGKDGTSYFGTDPKHPWGRMTHKFWPRCQVEGTIITQEGPVDFKGRGMFAHALQGMKPHFAAARWNFANFQSPNYSAVLMEYTTPPSYGSTVVTVGGISKDGETLFAGGSPSTKCEHSEIKNDATNSWPEPGAIAYTWAGKTKDGKDAHAAVSDSLGTRVDRVDVMGELPALVKQIAHTAAGTNPYIYQYMIPKTTLKLKLGDEEIEEEGRCFAEATFIS